MAVAAKYMFSLKVDETQTLDEAIGSATWRHDLATLVSGLTGTLTSSSTVPATKAWSDTITIGDGDPVTSIDLTALAREFGDDVTCSGLKIQLLALATESDNSGAVTVDAAAAEGFNFFGTANPGSEQVALPPGAIMLLYMADGGPDVGAATDTVNFTGTEDDVIHLILVAG